MEISKASLHILFNVFLSSTLKINGRVFWICEFITSFKVVLFLEFLHSLITVLAAYMAYKDSLSIATLSIEILPIFPSINRSKRDS